MEAGPAKANEFVRVIHDFSYKRDNSEEDVVLVTGEVYKLVYKTSENWWYVQKGDSATPFYAPASYVEIFHKPVLDSGNGNPSAKPGLKEKPGSPRVAPATRPRLSKLSSEEEILKELDALLDKEEDGMSHQFKMQNEAKSTENDVMSTKSEAPGIPGRPPIPGAVGEIEEEDEGNYANIDSYQQMVKNRGKATTMTTTAVDRAAESETSDYKSGDSKGGSRESLDSDVQDKSCDNDSIEAKEDLVDKDEPAGSSTSTKPMLSTNLNLPPKPIQQKLERSTSSEYANLEDIQKSIHGVKRPSAVDGQTKLKTLADDQPEPNVPDGWTVLKESGEKIYLNSSTNEKWKSITDEHGRAYFYNVETAKTVWSLTDGRGNDAGPPGAADPIAEMDPVDMPKIEPLPLKMVEKQGSLSKAKFDEQAKKTKKSWSQSYVVLFEHSLLFYKDQKMAPGAKPKSVSSLGKTEAVVDLTSCQVSIVSDEKKKEVIQLTPIDGPKYLLFNDNEETFQHWKQSIENNIEVLKTRPATPSSELDRVVMGKQEQLTRAASSRLTAEERTKVTNRLKLWLKKRPTKDSLKAQGIYQDAVFGSSLKGLCEREKTNIPRFVRECLIAVEMRGLDVDGIYRVSGNTATVQKLRQMVDQNEFYDLNSSQWDIHIVTGALKLFFRELNEPLFTFNLFDKFLEVNRIKDRGEQLQMVRDIITQLPQVHADTMKELFKHFTEIIRHSSKNRMQAQPLAIVFGPTLLWPETKSKDHNLAAFMVQQGQLVELLILEYKNLFT